ncbi:MAG: hypothetical protein ACFFCS_18650 [Candidatus Hodarchaeota archaeon]
MKIKKIAPLHILSYFITLIVLLIAGVFYHSIQDFSAVFHMDLFFQGLTYGISVIGMSYIVFRIGAINIKRKSALTIILVDFFITALLVSIIQAFLAFFQFNDANMQLAWETATVLVLFSNHSILWFFFFELFKEGEKGNKFNLKALLILLWHLSGMILSIVQGMIGNETSVVLVIIVLPILISNVYLNIVIAKLGITLSKRIEKRAESHGFLFIGLSALIIVATSILAFLDYVILDQNPIAGTLVGMLYLIGFVFVYIGYITPMKSGEK